MWVNKTPIFSMDRLKNDRLKNDRLKNDRLKNDLY